jgi:hypothetical protein
MVEHLFKNATSLVDQKQEIIHSNIYIQQICQVVVLMNL